METERRRYPRYMVQEKRVMLIHNGNAGQIYDLSMGGCSCKCLVTESTFNNTTELSIVYSHGGMRFKLQDIHFDVVHNNIDHISPFTTYVINKCGLKFRDISSKQKKQIEMLISRFSNRL